MTNLNSYIEKCNTAGISSLNNASLNNNINNSIVNNNNNNTSSLKEDTLSLQNKTSKKGINKKSLIIGAIAGIGIAAGIIYAVKTGKLQSITADIEGKKVYNEALKTVDEFKNGSGNSIKRFADKTNSHSAMPETALEELDDAGNIRRIIFNDNSLDVSNIRTYVDSTGKKYDEIGMDLAVQKPSYVLKGVEELADGSRKTAKGFYFNNGKLTKYLRNDKIIFEAVPAPSRKQNLISII